MKKGIYLFVTTALFIGCTSPKETTVHLKGQLIDMGSNMVTLAYDGAESLAGNSKDFMLITDENGNFDTTLTITEPAYYQISRNTLYLTPGDDLTIKITQDSREAEFTGKGAEVNDYMKYRLFPKGGSYLEAGRNIINNYEDTKALIDSLAGEREKQLDALKEATDEFKALEHARIRADIANSYLSYASYAMMKERSLKNPEERKHFRDSLYQRAVKDAKPIFKEVNNDKYLDVAVVRDIMYKVVNPRNEQAEYLAEGLTVSPYMTELYAAARYVNKLRGKISEELFNEVNTFIGTMQQPELVTEIKAKVEQATKLMKGRPAIDFEMTDVDGNVHKLSEFKGKILFLDFWATWCGPCVYESPFFEKLAKEYEGKDIQFIPISTDKNKKDWLDFLSAHKKELPQYNSVDEKIYSEWAIHSIPRFILIDKNFNIIDAYASKPSQEETKELLKSLLQ